MLHKTLEVGSRLTNILGQRVCLCCTEAELPSRFVARCNLHSLYTNTSQARPYDEICEVLMQRCYHQPETTNWWAIAHVLPNEEVIRHLNDEQKGVLLAEYFNLMHMAGDGRIFSVT